MSLPHRWRLGLCLLGLFAAATGGPAQADTFTLEKGEEFEICRDMAENLKAFPDLPAFPIEMPLDPRLSVFRPVDWETLIPLEHEDVLREYLLQRMALRDFHGIQTMSSEEREMTWQAWRPVVLREARAGGLTVERATYDSNQDGKKEPVYRVGLKDADGPVTPSGPGRGFNLGRAHLVLSRDDPKSSLHWSGFSSPASLQPFYYKDWLYYFHPARLEVQLAADGGNHVILNTVCRFARDHDSSISFQALTAQMSGFNAEAVQKDMDYVRAILRAGGDPNTIHITGLTLLELATFRNYREDVKALLEAGADPNRCGLTSECPLRLAVDSDSEILRLLIAAGADAHYVDEDSGETLLTMVSGQSIGYFFIGKSGLYYSGRHGPWPSPTESTQILIDAGADVNHVDSSGRTPLNQAIRAHNFGVARLLLEAGADANQQVDNFVAQDEQGERTLLMYVAEHYDSYRDINALKVLLDHGADANQPVGGAATKDGQDGNTVLMQLLGRYDPYRDTSVVKLLLDRGANPNDANDLPYDPTCEAAPENPCPWRGYTVLTFAADKGWSEIVGMLLAYGADPAIPRSDSKSALDLAEAKGHESTARLLRQKRTPAPQ